MRAVAICTCLLGYAVGTLAWAGGSESKVKITAEPGKIDAAGKQKILLTLNIEPGWHIYANPVGNPDFAPVQTTVTVKGKVDPKATKIEYPAGAAHKETVANLTIEFNAYENKVQIPVTVHRLDNSPLDLVVRIQACSSGPKGVCLPKKDVKISVP